MQWMQCNLLYSLPAIGLAFGNSKNMVLHAWDTMSTLHATAFLYTRMQTAFLYTRIQNTEYSTLYTEYRIRTEDTVY